MNRVAISSSNPTPLAYIEESMIRKDIHPNVHRIIIYNSQNIDITRVHQPMISIRRRDIYVYVCVCLCTHTHTHIHICVCFSVTESCPTLCDPMNCTIGFLVLHYLPEISQIMSTELVLLSVLSSAPLSSFCLQSFLESESFPMSHHFTSGGQSIGASASVSILSINI